MKKTTLLTALLICSRLLFAQDGPLQKGSIKLNLGLGLGSYIKILGGKTTFPPLTASAEFAVNENTTVGPVIGYTAIEETDYYASLGATDTYSTSNLLIGGKANHYFNVNPKFDVYVGAFLGYDVISSKLVSKSRNDYYSGNYAPDLGGFLYGLQAGGRYKFTPNTAVFAELGYGIAVLNIGITLSTGK